VPRKNGSRLLCTTERVLNNSVKQPLGVSPNTILFGNAFSTDRSLLTQIDQDVSGVKSRSTQDFVDTLIARQALIINAAIHSQTAINEVNLQKRYANYARSPKLRKRLETEVDNHSGTTQPMPTSFILTESRLLRPPIFAATKWIQVKNPFSGSWIIFNRYNLTSKPSTP